MKRYFTLLILIAVTCTCLFGAGALTAFADEIVVKNFDETYVLSDLQGATIDGKAFYTGDYPKDANGSIRLLAFTEYAFSIKDELRQYYGLYMYLYNPQAIDFANNEFNTVEIATDYRVNDEGNTVATHYDKLHVTICNSSADKLFIKVKIDDVAEIYSRVSSDPDVRRYDIASIELVAPRQTYAQDYKVGGTWLYSGYAKGCDESSTEVSTLAAQIKQLKVIDLGDLQFNTYRAWNDTAGEDNEFTQVADQLTSVYFSVPTNIAREYDVLYSIQAETYKYLTAPIFNLYKSGDLVFMNYTNVFNDLVKQRGINLPLQQDKSFDRVLYWDCTQLSSSHGSFITNVAGGTNSWGYRRAYNYSANSMVNQLPQLAWLFQIESQDYVSKHPDEFNAASVTSAALLDYMSNYKAVEGAEKVNGKYSVDLFTDRYWVDCLADERVTNGYLPINIDISGEYDYTLVGSSSKQTFWHGIFGTTGLPWNGSAESEAISPIIEVTYSDIREKSTEQIAKEFYISEQDVQDFVQYVASQTDRVIYLFRFDQSKYVSSKLYNNFSIADPWNCNIGYMFQEMAYLDFDIISLGYSKDGIITVLPVVSNPIDIVPSGELGSDDKNEFDEFQKDFEEWWQQFKNDWNNFWGKVGNFFNKAGNWLKEYWWVVAIVVGLILLGLFGWIIKPLGKVLLAIVKAVFKGLWWLLTLLPLAVVWLYEKIRGKSSK